MADGLLDRGIFSDPDVYNRELAAVFGKSWLFVGHETLVPEPGDYVSTFMGNDSVILSRGQDGRLHVLLNSCRHRGNKVCLFDRGNTSAFVCSYHGWRYGSDGKLIGVPYQKTAYLDELDTAQWGLVEAPRIETYAGFIFASWDADAVSLARYLGDAGWYLANLVAREWAGGISFRPGHTGYRVASNWKIIAENFVGDHYHTRFTHRSSFRLGLLGDRGTDREQDPNGPFEVSFDFGHGVGGVYTGETQLVRDLKAAERLPAHLVDLAKDYVHDVYAKAQKFYTGIPDTPYGLSHGTIFPNLCFSDTRSVLGVRGFYLLHPVSPVETEIWQWLAVDRNMPPELAEIYVSRVLQQGQLSAGLFAQDDAENFERVTEASNGWMASQIPLNLQMTLAHEGDWPGRSDWRVSGLPGFIGPQFSEHCQRNMYRYWAQLMGK